MMILKYPRIDCSIRLTPLSDPMKISIINFTNIISHRRIYIPPIAISFSIFKLSFIHPPIWHEYTTYSKEFFFIRIKLANNSPRSLLIVPHLHFFCLYNLWFIKSQFVLRNVISHRKRSQFFPFLYCIFVHLFWNFLKFVC